MAAKIYIVAGFLGAGKTTFIQKIIRESFQDEKVALIENDFGDISVDTAILSSNKIEIKEINSGCICCSLSGNFVKALKELLERFKPDSIIIEPSGVGKLSDIMKSCMDSSILPLAKVVSKITVVDVKRCKIYVDNFGEFFEDQIKHADAVLLSRTKEHPEKIASACELIQKINSQAVIFSQPWEQINLSDLSAPKGNFDKHIKYIGHRENFTYKRPVLYHHKYIRNLNHTANEIFDTVTIHTDKIFDMNELKERIDTMEKQTQGTILRAKGILRSHDGYLNLQYLPGDIQIEDCSIRGNVLCIIGRNLNHQELIHFFRGEEI